jgi:hypothetical protein
LKSSILAGDTTQKGVTAGFSGVEGGFEVKKEVDAVEKKRVSICVFICICICIYLLPMSNLLCDHSFIYIHMYLYLYLYTYIRIF